MNALPARAVAGGEAADARWWLWAALALGVCLTAISRQSLWIDEAFMATKTMQPTLAAWWQMMPEGKGSDLQMPLYMIYAWSFGRLFGVNEWALRAANIPWFVAGVTVFIRALPQGQKAAAAIVTLVSPFAWYYLNEARPYTMQLGASLILFAALFQLSSAPANPRSDGKWFAAFCFGLVALCGSSLLGVIWAGAALLSLPFLAANRRWSGLARAHLFALVLTCVLLAGLAIYYSWTFKPDANHSASSQSRNAALDVIKAIAHFRQGLAGGTDAGNVAFIGYELLGLGGLGPGRAELRISGLTALRPFVMPLAAYALVVCDVLFLAVWKLYRGPTRINRPGVALVVALPMLLLLGAGYCLKFRVLGRHFTPFMPVIIFLLSVGLAALWSRRGWVFKLLAAVFIVLSVASCVSFRFAARHEKDDYRGAAAAADAALKRGQRVWWSADAHGAAYYNVPLAEARDATNEAVLVQNPMPELLSRLAPPDVIVVSKPDLYDVGGGMAEYLRSRQYLKLATLQAFTIWRRPGL